MVAGDWVTAGESARRELVAAWRQYRGAGRSRRYGAIDKHCADDVQDNKDDDYCCQQDRFD
jgi:hypothetical protein